VPSRARRERAARDRERKARESSPAAQRMEQMLFEDQEIAEAQHRELERMCAYDKIDTWRHAPEEFKESYWIGDKAIAAGLGITVHRLGVLRKHPAFARLLNEVCPDTDGRKRGRYVLMKVIGADMVKAQIALDYKRVARGFPKDPVSGKFKRRSPGQK
jgi:hypothetical protein